MNILKNALSWAWICFLALLQTPWVTSVCMPQFPQYIPHYRVFPHFTGWRNSSSNPSVPNYSPFKYHPVLSAHKEQGLATENSDYPYTTPETRLKPVLLGANISCHAVSSTFVS